MMNLKSWKAAHLLEIGFAGWKVRAPNNMAPDAMMCVSLKTSVFWECDSTSLHYPSTWWENPENQERGNKSVTSLWHLGAHPKAQEGHLGLTVGGFYLVHVSHRSERGRSFDPCWPGATFICWVHSISLAGRQTTLLCSGGFRSSSADVDLLPLWGKRASGRFLGRGGGRQLPVWDHQRLTIYTYVCIYICVCVCTQNII